MSTLTRAQMAKIIREERGSITYQGRIIKSIEDLPSEAELAVASGNAAEEKRVQNDLLAEMARIKAELEKLQGVVAEDKTPKTRKAQSEASVSATT